MATNTVSLTASEQRVLDYIDRHEEDLFGILKSLIDFRTPNPPGGNESEAQAWVSQSMLDLGLTVDMWDAMPGRPNVIGVWKGEGDGPTVALNGHIDVCEDKLLDKWTRDPYDAQVEGRDMFGRGSSDMKSANASFMFAVEALQKSGVRLAGDVILQSVMGEEGGEPGTRSAIDHGYGGDFAIVGECSSAVGLVACVGVMSCRITVKSPNTLHLVHRKFTVNAGGNLEGANCVEKLATRIIPALSDLERQWAVHKLHPLIPPGACNINVFRVEGGTNSFILPSEAQAYVTITYLPNESKEDVTAEIEAAVHAAAQLDGWMRKHPPIVEWGPEEFPVEFAPSEVDVESDAIRTLQASIEAVGREPVLGGRGGITDAGWFERAGIPTVVFGPGDVQYAHAIDERVHMDDVVDHCKATAVFLMRFCGASAED